MKEFFQSQEWEKTLSFLEETAENISLYDTKGNLLFGQTNPDFKYVDKPDTENGMLFIPNKMTGKEVILICKPKMSIDKSLKLIQKGLELLKSVSEKKEEQDNLALLYEYLQSIKFAKDFDILIKETMEFIVHKLKLVNCSIQIQEQKFRYITNNSKAYDETERRIEKQVMNTKVVNKINEMQEDFMLKDIENITEMPKSMFAVPLIKDRQYIGTIFCYSENINSERINKAEMLSQEFILNMMRLNELMHAKVTAETDNLTGLYNRLKLFPDLNSMLERNSKEEKPTSVLIFDIDNFKQYNDTYGHLEGDKILQEIAKETKKISGITFRYGGEEFVVLLDLVDAVEAKEIAEELRQQIEENCPLTVSVGCITCKNSKISETSLLSQADQALYKAKNLGKNKVVQFIIVDKSLGVIDTSQV